MTVQEIFNFPAVRAVEIEILNLLAETDNHSKRDMEILGLQHLLHLRKKILDNMFVMTDEIQTASVRVQLNEGITKPLIVVS